MSSPNLRVVQSDGARRAQAQRELDALPWAKDKANRLGVRLSKAVIFGLLPICFIAWLVAGSAH